MAYGCYGSIPEWEMQCSFVDLSLFLHCQAMCEQAILDISQGSSSISLRQVKSTNCAFGAFNRVTTAINTSPILVIHTFRRKLLVCHVEKIDFRDKGKSFQTCFKTYD